MDIYEMQKAIAAEAGTGKNGGCGQAAISESEVIAALEQFICRYLILPDKPALPLACWVAATYFYETFDTFPYLSLTSPVKRCGKTQLAEVLGYAALNPVLTTGISEAALFRLVDRGQCTLLLDEAEALKDKKNERSQAIVSILNAGYRQAAYVYRCVPPKHELQPLSTYCPKAVIAIGSLPETVFDRSIVVWMRRKKAGEVSGDSLPGAPRPSPNHYGRPWRNPRRPANRKSRKCTKSCQGSLSCPTGTRKSGNRCSPSVRCSRRMAPTC